MIRKVKTIEDRIIDITSIIISVLVIMATLYPIYYCLIYSLNNGTDSLKGHMYLFPREFTLDNYKMVLSEDMLVSAYVLTIARTIIGAVTGVLFTAMTAYGLSKDRLKFRRFYSLTAIVTMYFSGGLIPGYLLLSGLHLTNTFWVMIVPSLFSVFNALLFVAYFKELPAALEESAKIDGAHDFRIFVSVAMPLSKPVLATVALFVGVYHWNDWFTPAFFTTSEKLETMPVILMRLITATDAIAKIDQKVALYSSARNTLTTESVRYATMLVAIIPITLVYPFIQRFFVKGLLIGSIKA